MGDFHARAYELRAPRQLDRTAIVLRYGTPTAGMVLRVNSACVTSEAFGDDSCDCARQLTRAFALCASYGSGMIIYAPFDEGRGVGLFGKLRSMALMQASGLSSRDAFAALGLPVDARDFDYVGPILQSEHVTAVRVFGRNLAKIEAIQRAGIEIIEILGEDAHPFAETVTL
jgi:GTP cyclohydrolase II